MTEVQQLPVVEELDKPLSLVPVGLKEAALDSPTFRATAIHFSDQIEVVERWLGEYAKAVGRLVQEIQPLEGLVSDFLARSTPPANLSEAVVDQDYTLLAMQRFGEGAREFWSYTISSMKKIEVIVLEPVRAFLQGELRNFKEVAVDERTSEACTDRMVKDARQYLAQTQRNFDSTLSRYVAQSKVKEPSALREDAFQLYEARKMYLKASMEFCVLAPQLRSTLDKLLVRVFSDQWREMRSAGGSVTGYFGKWGAEMDRIQNWSTEMEAGEKTFKRELQSARKTLEENTVLSCRPSRELDEYSASVLSSLGTRGPPVKSGSDRAEKQGWLFLRTLTGKPTRTIWVRRWFFVKRGIFGWLIQSRRTGGVEESERIGVLLCSVRSASQEERRFCFEIKTKDNTILLQAETQAELMEWVEVFESAKKAALDNTENESSHALSSFGQNTAFAISPPSVPEFAVRASNGHGYYGSDDLTNISYDRSATQPILDRDVRSSFDLSSRRLTASEKEGDGVRDSASRIIHKLDLHRKSAAGSQLSAPVAGGPMSTALGTSGGGAAGSSSTNYNVLSNVRGPIASATALAVPLYGSSAELTAANIAAVAAPTQSEGLATSTSLAPSTLANPPAPTNLSKTAVVVSGERGVGSTSHGGNSSMPNGMMANFWGTISAPIINRLERPDVKPVDGRASTLKSPTRDEFLTSASHRQDESSKQSNRYGASDDSALGSSANASPSPSPSRGRRNTITTNADSNRIQRSGPAGGELPPNYPVQLKMQNAQFRILFPEAEKEDQVLLVFRAAWNPNEQQDFPSRVYVTESDVYFYSHHLGLVLTSSICLGSIEEVTAAPGKDVDLLYLHLKEGRSKAGYTRITVKVFLENLRLLQRRLNFLVRNYHEGRSLDLESILNKLLMMNHDPEKTPSLESWEDISIRTPNDGGSTVGKTDTSRKQRDLRTTIRIDRHLHRDVGEAIHKREATRFRLPAGPVVYVPDDRGHMSAEKQFDISAKALFHLMFGDKSTLFQILYHERRAQHAQGLIGVLQTPWRQLDGGQLRRDFVYQTDAATLFGRTRPIKVEDHQDIEVLNDHLCYVVTDTKTPWHLPHWTYFKLLSRIVVTHIAKSRCKLAIYTRVEWSQAPIFSRAIVEKQAIDDLRQDALRLADVVTDQVSRLGRQSRTQKAIDIFGHIGKQQEASALSTSVGPYDSSAGAIAIRPRSLTHIFAETAASVAESVISFPIMWAIAMLRQIWKVSSSHSIIIGLLASSVLMNFFISSQGTLEWWNERKTADFMARLGVGPNLIMSRSVTLDGIDELVGGPVDLGGDPLNRCFTTFQSFVSTSDDPSSSPSRELTSSAPPMRAMGRRLRRTRQQLGTYRHDLLVAMKVVNTLEREILRAEWESWVRGEMFRCDQVGRLIHGDLTATHSDDGDAVRKTPLPDLDGLHRWHDDYCGSCRREQRQLETRGSD